MMTKGYREIYIDDFELNDEISVSAEVNYEYKLDVQKCKRHGYASELDDPDLNDIEVGQVYITSYQFFKNGIEMIDGYGMTNEERIKFTNYVNEQVEKDIEEGDFGNDQSGIFKRYD